MTVEVIRAGVLGEVPHGFLGRRGGVSTGELAGLNVGYGSSDDRAAIDENRRRAIAAVLPGAELATVHQQHTATVIVTDNRRHFLSALRYGIRVETPAEFVTALKGKR